MGARSALTRPALAVPAALALLAGAAARGEDATARFVPAGPAAAELGPNPALACPRSGAASALAYELDKASDKAERPKAQQDGRLCAMAQSLLAWDPQKGDSPPAPVVAFLSTHVGLAVPVKRAVVAVLELGERGSEGKSSATEEDKAIAAAYRGSIGAILQGYQQPRWGMATERVRKGVVKVALVVDDRALELDPLPRKLSAGQAAAVSGKVLPPYTNPRLSLSDVKGQATKVEPVPGDAFKGELRCGDAAGDLWVEVQAERDGRVAPVTAFPVACGKDLPTSVALSTAAWPTEPAAQERRLADGVNSQREAAGLARLEWDERLAGAARTVAETLRDQLGKGEAPAVDLRPVLEKAGVPSALVLQNPAQAKSAEEAEQRFTASPTNRQNTLNPEVNRVGVGIAQAQDATGRPSVVVVELFTKALAQVDPQAVRKDLYAAVAMRRAEGNVAAAAVDPKLEKVAEEYAAALAQSAGKLSPDDAGEITQGIRIAYKSIDMVEGAKANPLDVAADPAALSPGTAMGIGVAQGDHPVLGKNAVYLALIVATPRAPEAGKPAAKPTAKPAPAQTKK